HLSQAARINRLSGSGEALGYIEFTDYADTTYRYDVSGLNYVEYGELGSLIDLAGPVSQLQFSCYDGSDMASGPITDVNAVNLIKIEVTMTNSAEFAQDLVLSTSVFLNGGAILTTPDFEGWWCMDDDGGQMASDSSGRERHGTLENMSGNEWTTGVLGGALEFNGNSDYVDLPIGKVIENATDCTFAAWVKWSGQGDNYQRVFDFGSSTSVYMFLMANGGNGKPRFSITDFGSSNDDDVYAPDVLTADWHHMA
ncbi:MAG: LamG domain-containing protein, partial [Planctomycetes bacterium]|nr:LamG domain-containing protein [Planctomycetota bacterium]